MHSFVRNAAKIPFPGTKIVAMSMVDVELSNVTFDDRWMNYFFNKDMFMNVTRMPSERPPLWRVYMGEPSGDYVFMKDQQRAFQEVADKLGIGFRVGEPAWASVWDVHNNIADRYRNGRLLICGDASHVHSPSGGQGMNGCMQDAFNLGWKLAAVWHGKAPEKILDTYEEERKPIGAQISAGAMATHEIVMGFGIEPADRIYKTKEPDWEARTVSLVSGLSHNYCDVVKLPTGLVPRPGPKPGERAPDALLVREPKRRLYDVFRRPQFTLLVVPGESKEGDVRNGALARDELNEQFEGLVSTFLISQTREDLFDFDHQSRDTTGEFRERYQIDAEDRGRLVLVRPDLYIGLSCLPEEWSLVIEYMKQWYTPSGRGSVPS